MRIPILKTAFAGFALLSRKPAVALGLILLQALSYVLLAALPLLFGNPPEAPAGGFGAFALVASQALVVLGAHSIGVCAIFRTMLRPEEEGSLFGIRIGRDELRIMALTALLAFAFAVIILLGWLLTAMLVGRRDGAALTTTVALIINGLMAIPFLAATALAGPQSFAGRALALPSAWKMAGRAFWPLAGALVLVTVTSTLIYIVILMAIGWGARAMGIMVDFDQAWVTDYSSIAGIFTPTRIVLWPVGILAGAATTLLWTGVGASAYARLSDKTPQQQADVFA